MWTSTRTTATALDSADALTGLRDRYDLTPGLIHLDGSGAAPPTGTASGQLRQFVEHRWKAWEAQRSRSRAEGERPAEALAAANSLAPLIGADPRELAMAESTVMNLFKMLLVATHLRPDRGALVVGHDCFAADWYLARSAADFAGCELRPLASGQPLSEVLDEDVAVLALSHADLATGAVRDPSVIGAAAHERGALMLWDLSHSAGALDVDLHGWAADLAIGCGHKYLGDGAGAPAYSFLAEQHRRSLAGTLPEARCDPSSALDPLAPDLDSAPSTLSITALREGLSALEGVPVGELENKTHRLIELFLHRLDEQGTTRRLALTPLPSAAARGSQVLARHPDADSIAHHLFASGVVVDFVEPDALRFSFAPSWLRYVDVWEAAELVHSVLEHVEHRRGWR